VTGGAGHVERLKAALAVALGALYLAVEPLEGEAALSVVVKLEVFKVCLLVTTRARALPKLTVVDVLMTADTVARRRDPLLP
jgi:hypothetical protein